MELDRIARDSTAASAGNVVHGPHCTCNVLTGQSPGLRRAACPRCGALSLLTKPIKDGALPFLVAEAILPQLKATTKEEAIREVIDSLVATGTLAAEEKESIAAAVLKREELGSTGIGDGIAIPHAKHPALRKMIGTVAQSQSGVEFDAVDGQSVHLIILLLSSPACPADHVRALAAIAQLLEGRDVSAQEWP
jgi:mannitol/fructose-specific phosphotransferase system IIA component (Ntr-type)